MPQFVIQEHRQAEQVHWDLMLEQGGHLATWQVTQPPGKWSEQSLPCQKIFDHRRRYLSYEGPLSRDRGSVKIVARGSYSGLEMDEKHWHIMLAGDTISGIVELRQVEQQWFLQFKEE